MNNNMENTMNTTNNNYNILGDLVIDNRNSAVIGLTVDDFSDKDAWKKYNIVLSDLARNAYNYVAVQANEKTFNNVRSAIHAVFTQFGIDTRILALDGYVVRLLMACVEVKPFTSDALRAVKRTYSKAKKVQDWYSNLTDTSVLDAQFFNNDSMDGFKAVANLPTDINAIIADIGLEIGHKDFAVEIQVAIKILKDRIDTMKKTGHYYNNYKEGFNKQGKVTAKTRIKLEDAIADMLCERQQMSAEALIKEYQQIKGGRKNK